MPGYDWPQTCIEAVPPAERLAHVRYCSPFSAGLIDNHPRWLEQLQDSGRLDEPSPPSPERAREWIAAYGLDDGLRAFRNQEMLRIIWRDLNGLAPLGEVFADLTELAEICMDRAIEVHHTALSERHGMPRDPDGQPQSLVVLGLGKLGGVELNLSSDIDLIFCYPAGGQCDGRRGLSNEQYFTRLSRAVIASLADIRETGFCFRVDTRLRPFGQAGPVCCSFAAMEQYYQREGREWERYALVKARPVAGDIDAGASLLDRLRPFVYRRYIDFGAIESLREMQAMVHAEAARRDLRDDIKRGPGGIREVEFLAQGFQLLRGGREPRLQTPRLAAALSAIGQLGLMPAKRVDEVREQYARLRHVENRLQAIRDEQTHRIPRGEGVQKEDLGRLAAAMGAPGHDALLGMVADTRRAVSQIFDQAWAPHADGGGADAGSSDELEPWRKRWAAWRTDTSPGNGPVGAFVAALAKRAMGQRAQERLDRLMPLILRLIEEKSLDDATVTQLLDLVLTVSRRSAYLALLAEHPAALERSVELFGRSHWVAQRVARFPELLDELIDPALGQHIPDRPTLQSAARRKLESGDTESALAGLNYIKQAVSLRLAVAWLEGRMDESDIQVALADLAEVMIECTLRMAGDELEARHGAVADSGVAVIGYGSLGARELGFESDLDLVFLYRRGAGESQGARPLAAERWFARLAQRMVALLTALTTSGRLYDIDTRLRPNGQSGLLVSPMDAFQGYQENEAWTWEAQALTRARAIAGDRELMSRFEDIRRECLARQRDVPQLAGEIAAMRDRVRESHGEGGTTAQRLKHAPGGLVDIGFMAQLGVLSMAPDMPEVAESTSAARQIELLCKAGWIDPDQRDTVLRQLARLRRDRIASDLGLPKHDFATDDTDAISVAALFMRLTGG